MRCERTRRTFSAREPSFVGFERKEPESIRKVKHEELHILGPWVCKVSVFSATSRILTRNAPKRSHSPPRSNETAAPASALALPGEGVVREPVQSQQLLDP